MSDSILITLEQSPLIERISILSDFIRQQLFDFLELDSIDEVAGDVDFASLGADSMQAVDFKTELESHLKCSLRTTLLFDHPRLNPLVDHLLNDILSFKVANQESQDNVAKPANEISADNEESKTTEIAIIAMAGIFPDVDNAGSLWEKTSSGNCLNLNNQALDFGRVDAIDLTPHLNILGISPETYSLMGLQQKLMFKVIAESMADYKLCRKDLSAKRTGVFIGAKVGIDEDDRSPPSKVAYRIPIPNEISFHLDLKGPSEVFNTFCTSVYVALHRAIQSILSGECEQAIVGGVNVISKKEFLEATKAGLYDELLSKDNKTQSFSDDASGYTRCEGAGVIIIKPIEQSNNDKNKILAVVKGTAVYHGGRGYSVEAPNAQGMKEAIKQSVVKSGVNTETIDYIEAHGIGNVFADAVELGAIDSAYRQLSSNPDKQWHISTVKPTIGHPEIAAGMASLIKVIKAFEHETIPGLASLGKVNSEIGVDHLLVLQKNNQVWKQASYPRRAALNSFAIGGVNAHIILEQWDDKNMHIIKKTKVTAKHDVVEKEKKLLNQKTENILTPLFFDAFEMEFSAIDRKRSIVEYGFDSINVIQFVTRVNESLGITIKIGQVLGVDTIADFIQLIARGLDNKDALAAATKSTTPTEIPAQFPLSEVQKGLWYIQKTLPTSTSFNVPLTFKILEEVNSDCLEKAFTLMLQEYPMLSPCFVQDSDTEDILQVPRLNKKGEVTSHILLGSGNGLNIKLLELLREPFDLENDLLIRLYIVENFFYDEYYVYFVIHHIIFDGISGTLFITEFWEKYNQLLAGKNIIAKAPDFAFYDYVNWEQDYLKSLEAEQDLAWWKAQLEDKSPTVNLPYDKIPQPGETNLGVGCESITLNETLFQDVKQLTVELNANFSVVLLAIFNMFLYKLCQETDIVVSSPVLGRPKQAFEKSIGCYINLMVTRNQVSGDKLFTALLAETKDRFINGIDHAYYPFSKLMPELGLTLTNPNEIPFPISYTYQNIFDSMLKNKGALDGVEPLFEVYQEIEDNYTLEIYDLRESLKINLKYKRNLFEQSTVQRHLGYFIKLIKEIVNDSGKQVKDYDMLPETEKDQLIKSFNKTESVYPKDKSITNLFEAQAKVTPDAVAVVFNQQEMTYQTLEQKSKQLAIYLHQQGVTADSLVAVCMNRSIDMIVAIFAILRAGGAYLPIDPNNATDRISYLLEDGRVKLLLSQTALQEKLSHLKNCQMLFVDGNWVDTIQAEATITDNFKPQNLAYVIYTSGSSGKPKGVMLTQQSLVNLSYAMIAQYNITDKDRIVQFASLSFDMSVEEIFPYLIVGATVVIRQKTDIQVDNFYRLVMDNAISIINIPPLFYNVIDLLPQQQKDALFTQLRLVAFGGEALPEVVLKAVQNYDIKIFNAYGPTECTVNAAIADVSETNTPTIGKPILNTQLYILSKELSLLPIGVNGELHIAGDGVAKGYLNLPELSSEKFIDNPFGNGKLYKTGDIVKWTTEGNIEYIGRLDDQVKIRGYRVELGEVEAVLANHEQVESAVVVAQSYPQGNKLIAYYALEEGVSETQWDGSTLRAYFRKQLPDYMVPSAFIKLDKIPVTSNGKADRQNLQSREVDFSSSTKYLAPITEVETGLVDIWQQVLEVEKIGIEDDFFALGGHSLLAVQIILKINKEYSVDIPLSTIFEAEDIKNLALVISDSEQVSIEDTLAFFEQESKEWVI